MERSRTYTVIFLAELQTRQKRQVKNTDGRSNASETIDREAIGKEVRLAIKSQACIFIAPRASGEDEADLVKEAPQVNMDHLGHKE